MLVRQQVTSIATDADVSDPSDALLVVEVNLDDLFLFRSELDKRRVDVRHDDRTSLLFVELQISNICAVKWLFIPLNDSILLAFVHVVPRVDHFLRGKEQLLRVSVVESECNTWPLIILDFLAAEPAILHESELLVETSATVNQNVFDVYLHFLVLVTHTDADAQVVACLRHVQDFVLVFVVDDGQVNTCRLLVVFAA